MTLLLIILWLERRITNKNLVTNLFQSCNNKWLNLLHQDNLQRNAFIYYHLTWAIFCPIYAKVVLKYVKEGFHSEFHCE